MDDYFLGSEVEEEYVDPDGYSSVDPETGLTPKQQAYLAISKPLTNMTKTGWEHRGGPALKIRLDGRTFGKNRYMSNHIDRHISPNPP